MTISVIYNDNSLSDFTSFDLITNKNNVIILNCQSCNLSKLDLHEFASLKILDCSENAINEIIGLECLTKLVSLNCSNNKISHLKGINNCKDLKILKCYTNNLSNLNGLEDCVKLEVLNFYDNNISDLYMLRNMIYLRDLCFAFNKVLSLDPIIKCTNLENLECPCNSITEIPSFIDTFSTLKNFDFSGNKLKHSYVFSPKISHEKSEKIPNNAFNQKKKEDDLEDGCDDKATKNMFGSDGKRVEIFLNKNKEVVNVTVHNKYGIKGTKVEENIILKQKKKN